MPSETTNLEFLPAADKARLEWLRRARLLFDGEHRKYFLDEMRTEFAYRRVRKASGIEDYLYVPDNMLDLAATQAADLLFGESPLIGSDSQIHNDRLAAIADRSGLQQVLHSAAVDAAAESEAFLEAIIWDEQVYIQQVDAAEMFPVGSRRPDGQFSAYIRRQLENVGGSERPAWMLLETTYRAGSIERHLFALENGKKSLPELALESWPAFAEAEKTTGKMPVLQKTGIPWNTMVWIPNRLVRGTPSSDYVRGVIALQDALNAKTSQMAVVLLQHANPKLLLPEESADADGKTSGQVGVFYVRQGSFTPQYLSWEAQLTAAQADRKFAMDQLLMQMQTSPTLLGLDAGAAAEAYQTVRVRAMPALNKAQRRSIFWTEGLRTALTAASMLEQTIIGRRYDMGKISVQLRDGIPVDAKAQAETLATQRAAGMCSIRRGLMEILNDEAKVETEIVELKDESAAATPPILLQTDQQPADMGKMPMPQDQQAA